MVTLHRLLYKMVHFPLGSQIPAETLMEPETSVCVCVLHSVPLKTHPFSDFPEHFKPTTQVKQLITKPFRTLGPTTVTIRLQSGYLPLIAFGKTWDNC